MAPIVAIPLISAPCPNLFLDSDEKISGEQPAEGDEEKPKEDKENQSESKDDSSEDTK